MKVHTEYEQGSWEWETARAGKITASEVDALITPLGKIRAGEGVKSYLHRKLAEKWTGLPLPKKEGVWNLDQGHFLEEYARPAFTLETGLEVKTCAFIEDDNGLLGCSPDGLIEKDCGLELKSPHLETHIGYLLDGIVPSSYVAQIQFSMFITGFRHYYFCSFRRGLPLFVLDVPRDDKLQASIDEAVQSFLTDLEIGWQKLCDRNGGPPPKRKVFVPSPPENHDPDDYKV